VRPERDPEPAILEFGGSRPGTPRTRWHRWWPLAVAALLVAAFVVRTQHPGQPSAAASPSPSVTPAQSPPGASPTPTLTAPVVTDIGHRLLDTAAGWELFGRTADAVLRIDPARGRVVRTPVPRLATTGPVSLAVGRDWAMVRPLDFVPGYLVPDGQPARELTGLLNQGGLALPGPDGASVWVPSHRPEESMVQVGLDGRGLGPEVPVPLEMTGTVSADGAGGLVLNGIGGSYSGGPGGLRRITPGTLVATGPTRWLAYECDDQYNCSVVAIDRRTGTRRVLKDAPAQPYGPLGVISPDGAHAALTNTTGAGGTSAFLVDLSTGATGLIEVPVGPRVSEETMVWSPDSRWLLVVGASGQVYAVDATLVKVYFLGAELPQVLQLAVRASPAAPLS
jgi:hypothetical protein